MKEKLLFLILLLVFPIAVYADTGMPTIKEYEVEITNENGAAVFDFESGSNSKLKEINRLSKGQKVTIYYEEYFGDILYGSFYTEKVSGYLKLSDTSLVNDFELKEEEWFYNPGKLYCIKDGAKLYKGPSFKYDYVDNSPVIKKGSMVSYKYSNESWAYINYNDKSGWVYLNSLDRNLDQVYFAYMFNKKNTIYTVRDLKISNSISKDDYYDVVIPAGVEIEYDTYVRSSIYVEYNGVKGWIKIGDPYPTDYDKFEFDLNNYPSLYALNNINDNKIILISKNNVKIYSDLSFKTTVGMLKPNVEVLSNYYFMAYSPSVYYVDYNGIKGWIKLSTSDVVKEVRNQKVLAIDSANIYEKASDDSKYVGKLEANDRFIIKYDYNTDGSGWVYINSEYGNGWVQLSDDVKVAYSSKFSIKLDDDLEMYKYPENTKLNKTIKKGTTVSILYNTYINKDWYYIEYDGESGWITTTAEVIDDDIPEVDEDELPVIVPNKKKFTKKEIAIISVLGAICLFATLLVIIILINKSKKKKIKNEEKEEKNIEEK